MVTRGPDPTPSLTNTPSPPCLPSKGLLSSCHFMRALPACWVPFPPGSLQKTLSSFRAPSLLGVSPSELPALMGCPSPSSSPALPSTKILLLRTPHPTRYPLHHASPQSRGSGPLLGPLPTYYWSQRLVVGGTWRSIYPDFTPKTGKLKPETRGPAKCLWSRCF